jgi:hypothetical protein
MFGVPIFLIMPLAGLAVMPFFGMFLTGLPGSLICLLLAALWAYSARLLYKLDARGWWLILVAMVAFVVSALLTYEHHNFIEIYQLMGYPQAQIDQIQKLSLFTGNRMSWVTVVCSLPGLVYLLFIKKYLRKT